MTSGLTRIGGRTLLDRQLAYLAAAGLTEVIVNLHYRAGDVLAYLRERRWVRRVPAPAGIRSAPDGLPRPGTGPGRGHP
jgi:NDP-sugar pyrophosphorylase family protein